MKTAILNVFFRGITLLSKFIFILFLGKYSLDETNLGVFGIFSTTIALLIYVIGFDFYVYNTREIIANLDNYIDKLKNQLVFHLVAYLAIIPLAVFFLFKLNFISIEYLCLLLILLVSEHLGQELYRLFTTLGKSTIANSILFIRSGLWVWYILLDFFVFENEIVLKKYIIIWAIFSWGSFFILSIVLVNISKIKFKNYSLPDWNWIGKGFKTSSVFFIGSLSFLVIQFSDRFMIDYFYGKKLVGVYTTYAQFTNAIDVFTFSAITMVTYPKLVKTISIPLEYSAIKRKFSTQLIIMSLFLILIAYFFAPFIFKFLGKKMIEDEINTFYILLGGVFFLITSNIFHYDLYVRKKDNIILYTAIIGVMMNVVLNLILIPKFNIFGAAIATLISFFVIFLLKYLYSRRKQLI
jgi:O-antigen/teichoic acid export membrane protein